MKENIKYIEEMLLLQDKLNIATCGENYKISKVTKENRKIDFARCIYMECAELIDSLPWKHWKSIDAKWDIQNIKIELVDIWHFILSLALINNQKDVFTKVFNEYKNYKSSNKLDDILLYSKELIHYSSAKDCNLIEILNAFLILLDILEFNFSDLFKIYIGKNVLNQFRQDNGYKNGTYKKIWDNKEDNVILYEILESLKEVNFDVVYNELGKIYKGVK
ncbi:dUTP diphosphatase [Campylobacter canadensis]|uniref:dUTP diphosphatase n=1 Tax=Campylobacter canadensis TaxID=449520 RepID=UPI001557272C|nr:dUTP diphosphatase [Campylobacter canadensis]MBZ7995213.1 dUTP diphosphatase [Campylobacter canadensis]MBZ7997222.1 dUTP diphosphatase [Campylobacter canadensis]MBZ8000919.1 dUTP diphosphatase [Campylobacter canadensis]MBZ8002407.1 dUTP diphosphatase [Campylobacter canadensis]MBZ8003525.1 dUTP diphosphatase [Campylobacter canadensis]